MTANEAVIGMIHALNGAEIPYMLVGSLASNYYGVPRSTQDADFVIECSPLPLAALRGYLGTQFIVDPQIELELVTGTSKNVVRLPESEFTIELTTLTGSHNARPMQHFR